MFLSLRWVLVGTLLGALALTGCSDDDGGNDNNNNNTNQGLNCFAQFVTSDSGETCVFNSLSETTRTPCGGSAGVWEDCDSTNTPTPDLSCLGVPDDPPPNPPAVTISGYLEVFSKGDEPIDVKVQVFAASDLVGVSRIDGSVASLGEITIVQANLEADLAAGIARACFMEDSDAALFDSVECVIPTSDCAGTCASDLDGGTEFCYSGNCYARKRYEGRYEIPNIPMHQPLVVRTSGLDEYDDVIWGVMAQVNVYLKTTDAEYDDVEGTYELDAQVLSRADWGIIPCTFGLCGGISAGYGAIAGEVHDCAGLRLKGAQVGFYPQGSYFGYFNGNPVSTVPLGTQLAAGTNNLGLYAGFELPGGDFTVEAWGLVGGTPTLLGSHNTFVFEDSVTVLSINDGKPTVE